MFSIYPLISNLISGFLAMKIQKIHLNRIRTPDGTILTSRFTHDCQTHFDRVAQETFLADGGTSYLRRNVTKVPAEELSIVEEIDVDESEIL